MIAIELRIKEIYCIIDKDLKVSKEWLRLKEAEKKRVILIEIFKNIFWQ